MRLGLCAIVLGLLLAATAVASQSPLPESFALRARATGNNRPVRVEITIERWTDAAVHAQLLEVAQTGGSQGFRAALQQLPAVAEMRVDAYRSYPLQFARELVGDDGGRRILLATHTPIGFQGGEGYFRASAGAFTLVELRVDADGEGDGSAEVTEEVGVGDGGRTLGLSGTRSGSVRLTSVRRVSD